MIPVIRRFSDETEGKFRPQPLWPIDIKIRICYRSVRTPIVVASAWRIFMDHYQNFADSFFAGLALLITVRILRPPRK